MWTATTGSTSSSPAVADGVVYVGSEDGLFAFSVGCGNDGATCTPLWRAPDATGASSPTVADGVVYVGTWDGYLYAYSAGCASGGGDCAPLWTAAPGYEIYAAPTVAAGVVYVAAPGDEGQVHAFAVDCNSAGGECAPLWTAATGYYNSSSPTVADGVVYVSSYDGLYAFPAECDGGDAECSPLWSGLTDVSSSSPAVADGIIYVAGGGGLHAFAVGCADSGDECDPLWTAPLTSDRENAGQGDSSPAVANGVVYISDDTGQLHAFDADCDSAAGECLPLWTGTMTDDPGRICEGCGAGDTLRTYSSPAVVDGMVYVVAWDGTLYAFGLPGNIPTPTPTAATPMPSASSATGTYQPDGWVRLSEECYVDPFEGCDDSVRTPWIGDGIYNLTAEGQTVVDKLPGGEIYAVFAVTIENDGEVTDSFTLQAARGGNASEIGWEFFSGDRNITDAVVAGTYQTPTLAPGDTHVITVKSYADAGSQLMTIASAGAPERKDAVKVTYKFSF
jgi:outer membrane protein assembly factor BamB